MTTVPTFGYILFAFGTLVLQKMQLAFFVVCRFDDIMNIGIHIIEIAV